MAGRKGKPCEECEEEFKTGSVHFHHIQKTGYCKDCWKSWTKTAEEHQEWENAEYPTNKDIDRR